MRLKLAILVIMLLPGLFAPSAAAAPGRMFGDYLGQSVTGLIRGEGPPRILPAEPYTPTLRLAYDELEMQGWRYYVEYEAQGHMLVRVNYRRLGADVVAGPPAAVLGPANALGRFFDEVVAAAGPPWARTMYDTGLYAADQLEYQYTTADSALRIYYDFDGGVVAAASCHYIADLPPSVIKPLVLALDAAYMARLQTPRTVLLDYAVGISGDEPSEAAGWRYKRLAADECYNYIRVVIATPSEGVLNMLMYFHDRSFPGAQSREADARHAAWLEDFARENPAGANFTPAPAENVND